LIPKTTVVIRQGKQLHELRRPAHRPASLRCFTASEQNSESS
jgi:hypothetical protein